MKPKANIVCITICIIVVLWFCRSRNVERDASFSRDYYFEFSDYYKCLRLIQVTFRDKEMDAEAHRLYQNVRMALDGYPALLNEYGNKVIAEPNDYLSNYLWGRLIIYDPNRTELAIKHLEKAIRLNPFFPWAYSALAQALINRRQFVQARQYSEDCLRHCGEFIPAHLIINFCIAEANGPIKAIEHLEKLVQRLPPDIDIVLRLANQYMLINEMDKARQFLEKNASAFKNDYRNHRLVYAMARCARSVEQRKRLLRLIWMRYPNSANIESVFSDLFDIYKQEDYSRALELARNALNYNTRIKRLRSIAFKRIVEYYEHKGPEELEDLGFDMLRADIRNPNDLNELGELLLDRGKADIALLLFDKAKDSCDWTNIKNAAYFGLITREEEKDETVAVHKLISEYNIGRAFYTMGFMKKAICYFEKVCLASDVLNEDALVYLAKCHISLANNSEAVKILLNLQARFGSKQAGELLKSISADKHGEHIESSKSKASTDIGFSKVDKISYLSRYKDKIVLLGLHTTSCNACLRTLGVIKLLESEYRTRSDIIFISLFSENDSNISFDTMLVNPELFKMLADEFKIRNVPAILVIDRSQNIRFRMSGIKDEKSTLEELRYKMNMLLEEDQ